jgi:hypothetical protein
MKIHQSIGEAPEEAEQKQPNGLPLALRKDVLGGQESQVLKVDVLTRSKVFVVVKERLQGANRHRV